MRNSFFEFSDNDRIELLDLMKESADSLYSLLENLLEWSRSQNGNVIFNPITFDLFSIVNDTITSLKSISDNKKINVTNNLVQGTMIKADINMINTILRNLITNAIKFTPDNGLIIVDFELNENTFSFFVKDNGVGISKEKIEQLFRIDTQISTKGTKNEKGTGLGLIICKEFIEKHHGEIKIESELGKGSTFKCIIPIN